MSDLFWKSTTRNPWPKYVFIVLILQKNGTDELQSAISDSGIVGSLRTQFCYNSKSLKLGSDQGPDGWDP